MSSHRQVLSAPNSSPTGERVGFSVAAPSSAGADTQLEFEFFARMASDAKALRSRARLANRAGLQRVGRLLDSRALGIEDCISAYAGGLLRIAAAATAARDSAAGAARAAGGAAASIAPDGNHGESF